MGRPSAYRTHITKGSRKKYLKFGPLQTEVETNRVEESKSDESGPQWVNVDSR